MKFAIIKASGTQYAVSEGDVISLDNQSVQENDTMTFDTVLLYVNDSAVMVGTPGLSSVSVKGTVINHEKGDKIRVAKFKAKSRSRKAIGYRHQYTNVRITSISAS
ncbi:50S ribosomal protein L21 [Candidatus Roizmanbacteria bacterium RIFCSPLOWO2_01_FULL_45_11]|uniref:Large ribosomal subunit protein bL21 n=1 Tax=Candidatus Roizmanbacteria bacterium RIFCSPLOWO2_01_FULL_45_11 TaxID=1802070 RepID=A0A1F7JE79_9BACT|nr:MAG: 50S ribosomal protein L21 [Candidatus Roizmanbacteria bacterium RIFCSPLOWO2_01_FULL_45_11]